MRELLTMDTAYPIALLTLFELSQAEIKKITDDLHNGDMTIRDWQAAMTAIIARYALAAVMLGAQTDIATPVMTQSVADYMMSQETYLDRFASDIVQGGSEWDNRWDDRAVMYGEAVQPLYWKEVTQPPVGKGGGPLRRRLVLPAYPGDCTSECLTSDRCLWFLDWISHDNLDVDAYWVTAKDNKICPTCRERGIRWYPLKVRNGMFVNL